MGAGTARTFWVGGNARTPPMVTEVTSRGVSRLSANGTRGHRNLALIHTRLIFSTLTSPAALVNELRERIIGQRGSPNSVVMLCSASVFLRRIPDSLDSRRSIDSVR